MRLGLIVNPIAGMGGKVGLKGTDGPEILEKARQLGAKPEAHVKATKALKELLSIKDQLEIITYPGFMGESSALDAGFEPTVIGDKKDDTGPLDTEQAAKEMIRREVDLLLFAGGDGTARNIHNAVGEKLVVVGIPAGVKIHSGVYANHPKSAGALALAYLNDNNLNTKEAEVMDIDEDAFRDGRVTAKLFGYMQIPYLRNLLQGQKAGGIETEEAAIDGIAETAIDEMEADVYYIIGSGSTLSPIMDKLGLENTLLGIDIIKNKKLVANDVNETQILETIGEDRAKIIVTVIGGQGYVFGRGNQQLSGQVIKKVGKENIRIVAPKSKLMSITGDALLVDTGDEEVNAMFNGYIKVLITYETESVEKIKGL